MKIFIRIISVFFAVISLPSLVINILWMYNYFPLADAPVWTIWIFISSFSVAMVLILILPAFFDDVWYRDQKEIDELKRRLKHLEKHWMNKLYE